MLKIEKGDAVLRNQPSI